MIRLENVTKTFKTNGGTKWVLNNICCEFARGRSVGILGANGAGKSTLLRIIAGTEEPTFGKVRRGVRMSWRLGLTGGFHGSLTGAENTKFVCRIYGVEHKQVLDYVENFAELGEYLFRPVNTYSSGMKARLAFGLSLALAFDVYLIDETTAVGDARFQSRCIEEMKHRLRTSDVIMVSHSANTLKRYCTHAAILHEGRLSNIMELGSAISRYKKILGV